MLILFSLRNQDASDGKKCREREICPSQGSVKGEVSVRSLHNRSNRQCLIWHAGSTLQSQFQFCLFLVTISFSEYFTGQGCSSVQGCAADTVIMHTDPIEILFTQYSMICQHLTPDCSSMESTWYLYTTMALICIQTEMDVLFELQNEMTHYHQADNKPASIYQLNKYCNYFMIFNKHCWPSHRDW